MFRKTRVQSQIESYQRHKKWYLMLPCLTLSIISYGSRVKWSNPCKGVPSPAPRKRTYKFYYTLSHIFCSWREACVHGSFLMRLPKMDIFNFREQNPITYLTSPIIHVLNNIPQLFEDDALSLHAQCISTHNSCGHHPYGLSIQSSSMPAFPRMSRSIFIFTMLLFR